MQKASSLSPAKHPDQGLSPRTPLESQPTDPHHLHPMLGIPQTKGIWIKPPGMFSQKYVLNWLATFANGSACKPKFWAMIHYS